MAGPYVLRVAFDLMDAAPLEPAERYKIEKYILDWLRDSRQSPLPDDTVIHCVEILPRCPCCDLSEKRCACLFEERMGKPFCLDHRRTVEVAP